MKVRMLQREGLREIIANCLITILMLIAAGATFSCASIFEQPRWLFALAGYLAPSRSNEAAMVIVLGMLALAAGLTGEMCFHGTNGRRYWLALFTMLSLLPIFYSILTSNWYDWHVIGSEGVPPIPSSVDSEGVPPIPGASTSLTDDRSQRAYLFDWEKLAGTCYWIIGLPTLVAVGALAVSRFRRLER
jgi:hypothetical protein